MDHCLFLYLNYTTNTIATIDFSTKYDILVTLSASSAGKEVKILDYIITFVLSVVADIVGFFIRKWLDRHKSDK